MIFIQGTVFVSSLPNNVSEGSMFLDCPIRLFVHSFVRSLVVTVPQYLMNGLIGFDKTDRRYSLATTDDLIRFGRSKVKFTAWFKYVVAKLSTMTLQHQSPSFRLRPLCCTVVHYA